jgi:hypothetical protein
MEHGSHFLHIKVKLFDKTDQFLDFPGEVGGNHN